MSSGIAMTEKFEKLDRLEAKIAKAIDRMHELHAQCEQLEKRNHELENELVSARHRNDELTRQINELKTASEKAGAASVNESEALKRIDRMLEKFGELQI